MGIDDRYAWNTDPMFLTDPDPAELRRLYAVPPAAENATRPFVRANFVMTVDGHVTGRDGLSGSINNAADKQVFDLLRSLADTVLVGAGTVRREGYGRVEAPDAVMAPDLVVVSNSGLMPDSVVDSPSHDGGVPRGRALLATHSATPVAQPGVEYLRCGAAAVDEALMMRKLHDRGARSVLCEGGPHLLTSLLAKGLVDELAITTTPLLVGSVNNLHLITEPFEADLAWRGGAVIDGTVFAVWRLS